MVSNFIYNMVLLIAFPLYLKYAIEFYHGKAINNSILYIKLDTIHK